MDFHLEFEHEIQGENVYCDKFEPRLYVRCLGATSCEDVD